MGVLQLWLVWQKCINKWMLFLLLLKICVLQFYLGMLKVLQIFRAHLFFYWLSYKLITQVSSIVKVSVVKWNQVCSFQVIHLQWKPRGTWAAWYFRVQPPSRRGTEKDPISLWLKKKKRPPTLQWDSYLLLRRTILAFVHLCFFNACIQCVRFPLRSV